LISAGSVVNKIFNWNARLSADEVERTLPQS
jgi:hypothetical protein